MSGYGMRNGFNLDNLEVTTDEEIDARLTHSRKGRGPLDPGPQYDMRANSVWLYTRPDFAKLHMRLTGGWSDLGLKRIITASSFANMHTYINQGWIIGIENCTRGVQQLGVTREMLMEAIMHAQLSAGMRGLELVFQAIGIILGDYRETGGPVDWPEGWAPDMDSFFAGIDKTQKELSAADKKAIEDWYERTIGWVPNRVHLLAKHDQQTLKAYRARWEGTFRGALPKQMFPYLSIRHNTVTGDREGLREAVALGKAWGMTDAYIVNTAVQGAYYFTGLERLDLVHEVCEELLIG
jgi:hypothetical protein